MTSSPTSFVPSADFGTGYYFGRFAEPNYPGFGAGKSLSNGTFYLVVMEEYVTGEANVGALLSIASNEIFYNVTTTTTTT
ncbi:hypothetical protein BT96DRAFT_925546 [Gymnopus androsaceus JB14]|uniref:Uncharacterized protein n=1 Tax=Gymnopus androsaceus JB14 TaxID=1447944 RepID=A0A6A4H105_9AGAR|nr:hypothetical protein BT96DRAFT_925546 [Gymnopus androsaceus JB14]